MRRKKTILGTDFDPGVLDKWPKKGINVLYGDMSDPDIDQLFPLCNARWLICTARSKEMTLALFQNVKKDGCSCKVALTATNEEEAQAFISAGANLVFRPFADAAEQAADALTDTMDSVPQTVDWPISFIEVQIKSDAAVVGQTITRFPLGP